MIVVMYVKKVVIQNKSGLHARPASDFIGCAKQFKSKITLKNLSTGEEVNAKSIVMLLSLGLSQGQEIELCAVGEDETLAINDLVALVNSKFGET